MHPSLRTLAHRPWPLPSGSWTWQQSWLDLAFLHYAVAPAPLGARLPPGLNLELFNGHAWIGVVPFRMAGVAPRAVAPLPLMPSFLELNVRTYVEADGRPGVWFFSLDAESRTIVFGGRRFYGLPYHFARMQLQRHDGWFNFSSVRADDHTAFRARYLPTGPTFVASPGTFAHWATERYCLYSAPTATGLTRVEIHHAPWPLQPAVAEGDPRLLFAGSGLAAAGPDPIVHFSPGVQVVSYAPQRV
ncbi:DUF2071 domain-containing protein [Horticoccus luteus]|uniref:DUF2071 domain-containing protein n=1 Tax=Horticoccus luteus TaxID=2862869 RepID=A0A8F9TUK2_9BACT|nr:DUF2071 domain-containing protein [Horticoccus luteus]QYM79544.1 DUF2071 domain-containing protein [Horticoccus luteus]